MRLNNFYSMVIVGALAALGMYLAASSAIGADEAPMGRYEYETHRPSTADTKCLSTDALISFLNIAEVQNAGSSGNIIAVRTVTGVKIWVFNRFKQEWCFAEGRET